MSLSIDTRTSTNGETVLTVRGELDFTTANQLRDAIDTALTRRPPHMCIDVSLVLFIDSTAIGVLVAGHHTAAIVGTRLRIANPSQFVEGVLRVTGLHDLLVGAPPN